MGKKIKRGERKTFRPKRGTVTNTAGSKRANAKSMTQVRGMILQYFRNTPDKNVNYKQVAAGIGAEGEIAYQLVRDVLEQLERERVIKAGDRTGRYSFHAKSKRMEGRFQRKAGKGHNMFYPNDDSEPIRIAERNSAHALDGDRVAIQLLAHRRGHEPEGEVIEILERTESTFVGVMQIQNGYAFLLTDSNKLNNDILIPERSLNGAQHGQKVLARITEWPERAKNPVGEVLAVIGTPGDNDTEMHAILAEYGLPYSYPEEVEQYADRLDEHRAFSAEYEREDFRQTTTFTIDPADAKDFDDALSFRVIGSGKYEVGVHIADVTAYVLPDDPIDKEAAKRATSVYLVDRTIPMLPERLCNDLCSLKPNVDRPAYSCIFTMNDDAEVLDYRITRTVIHSDRRYAYEEAQRIIEGAEDELRDEILKMNELAQKLRKERFDNGSIDFDRSELAFRLDEGGKPIEVYVKHSEEANKMIEEFMLLANRTVAKHVQSLGGKTPPTFVFRVHDKPDEARLQDLAEFVSKMGYRLNYTGTPDVIAKSINDLLDAIEGKPEEDLIQVLTIRTMAKAIYQTDNIGHYGLGFEDYTHFTSPIRRHPDMMVHRLLTRYLKGGRSMNRAEIEEICRHDSAQEKLASDAERTSIKYKQVEYMQGHLGEVFDGVISGVKEFGIFVELEANGCEGLVPIRELDDDFYELDEKTYSLVGYRHKRRYALGDKVHIRVAHADLDRRQLDFELV